VDRKKKLYKTRKGDSPHGDWGVIEENGARGTEQPLLEILTTSKIDWIPAEETPESLIDPKYLPYTGTRKLPQLDSIDRAPIRPIPAAGLKSYLAGCGKTKFLNDLRFNRTTSAAS
jgi:hypothetical protein